MVAKSGDKLKTKIGPGDKNDLVCRDTKIKLSDEKLKRLMSSVYEISRNDADKFRLNKYYPTFISFSVSLFIVLLTADFHDRFGFSGYDIENIIKYSCFGSLFCGLGLMIWNSCTKGKNRDAERDKAVEDAFRKLKLEAEQSNLK